jgi:hypothetical protein
MEEKKKGGKRKGAGRKPTSDPKLTIPFYVARSKILIFGSSEKLKEKVNAFIDNYEGENKIDYVTPPPDAYNGKRMDNYIVDEPILPQMASNDFEARLKACKNSKELKSLVSVINSAGLSFFPKQRLLEIANKMAENFYTD